MKHIRGDTFEFSGPVTLTVNGVETTDLTGYTATSQVRTAADTLIADLDVSFDSFDPAIIRLFKADTKGWPVGAAAIDIQFLAPSGRIVSTQTVTFEVTRDVTRAA